MVCLCKAKPPGTRHMNFSKLTMQEYQLSTRVKERELAGTCLLPEKEERKKKIHNSDI